MPTAFEDDAERSVRAGLELVAIVTTLGEEIGFEDLAIRVGIVTGEVAVTLGAEARGMVAGDAVNTAARVQSVATPGQVWVDETTRLLTSAAITYVDAGSHALKGKAEPVPLWSVRAVVAAVGGAQRADGLEAPLVGRDRDLRLVKELFHAVEESKRPGAAGAGRGTGGGQVPADLGVREVHRRSEVPRAVAQRTLRRLRRGRCLLRAAEAIRGRLQTVQATATDDLEEDTGSLIDAGLARYVADDAERTWLRPRLAALLGTNSARPPEDLFAAWTAFLERVGEDNPVVLIVDDAQHADEGLVLFIEHLLTEAALPCFVVLVARHGLLEQHPRLAANRRASLMHVEALSDPDMGLLVDGLVAGLPSEVRDSLVRRAEGLPLFAVETVRSLIDRDLVVPRGGQYVLADPDRLDLDEIGAPVSLQTLIAARLDTLNPDQRRVVDLASVIGAVFTHEQLVRLAGGDEGLDAALTELVRLQFLSVDNDRFSSSHGDHQFVQSAVRQVAYSSLSRRDRKAAHLAVAAGLEEDEDPGGELAAVVAKHYLDAAASLPGEPDVPDLERRAIDHLQRAAARARSLGAIVESSAHLRAALELAGDEPTRATIGASLAWALNDLGRNEESIEVAVAAQVDADATGDPLSAGVAVSAQARALVQRGEAVAAIALAEPRWRALAGVTGAEPAYLLLARGLNAAYSIQGEYRIDILTEGIAVAEGLGDSEQLAVMLSGLSTFFAVKGASHTSTLLLQAAADLGRAQDLPGSLSHTLTNLTVVEMYQSLEKALDLGRESVQVADRSGIASNRAFALYNLALVLLTAGHWDELDAVLDGVDVTTGLGSPLVGAVRTSARLVRGLPSPAGSTREDPGGEDLAERSWSLLAAGLDQVAAHQPAAALKHLTESVRAMVEIGGLADDLLHVWPVAADTALQVGDDATLDWLLELVDDQAGHGHVLLAVRAHRQRVRGLLAREREPGAAEQLMRESLALFNEWGNALWSARVEGELGTWLASSGQADHGQELMDSGHERLVQLGAHGWLVQSTSPA